MSGPIVVSGNIGSGAVHALAKAGVRAAGTDPQALAGRLPGVPAVRLDVHDPTSNTTIHGRRHTQLPRC